MNPYVSIDIETTGLNPDTCQILEFGAVLENGLGPVEGLPSFRCYLLHDEIRGEPAALAMNAGILSKLSQGSQGWGSDFLRPDDVGIEFRAWLDRYFHIGQWVVAAGKNVSGFDLPFLRKLPGFSKHVPFHHRTIDPVPYYWKPQTDQYPPSTQLCMERAGIPGEVAHTTVEDARTVIKLIRHAMPTT